MKDSLRRQAAFDDLIAGILARFASSVGAEVDEQICTGLREIARFIAVDYAYVVQASTDFTTWSATHEWRASTIPSHFDEFQNVPLGTFDWNERIVLAGGVVRVDRLAEIPPEAARVRRRWESAGFKSVLQVPLRGRGGVVRGCLGLSTVAREVKWAEADIKRLTLVSETIASALERKRAEEELRESEARFRATFEQAPVGILNVALDGCLLKANQRFCDMLGYTHEELLGRNFSELTHPDDCRASANLYQQVLAHRVSIPSLEKRYLRRDGNVVWGNLTLSVIDGGSGAPQTLIAVIEDITARKQVEETFDAVPDLILVLDSTHRIVRANKAAAERLCREGENLLGRHCYEVVHGRLAPPESCPHARVLFDGQSHQFETYEEQLDGDFLVTCTPLREVGGK